MRHDFKTLSDLYDYASAKYANRTAAEYTDGQQSYTYARYRETCDNLSRILSNFGISASDKVAILSENGPHWGIAFFATVAYGRVAVPMLNELSSSEVESILSHSGSKALFVSRRQLKKVSDAAMAKLSLVIDIDTFEFIKHEDTAFTCDGRVATPNPMDMAAIIYTSGTTGSPKGVMLSHRNFCASVLDSWYAQHENKHSVFLSILPMAHTYEMTLGLLYPYSVGARVCYLRRVPTPTILKQTLAEIRPTTMLSVPLIIEKMYKTSIIPTIRGSKFLSHLEKYAPRTLAWLVGIKLKKIFGGRLHFFGIGGAKLDPEVETFLHRASFPYGIGFGLTECAPLVSVASPKDAKVGTIGRKLPNIEIRLADKNEAGVGELQVKGPNVMLGYYHNEAATKEAFDGEWLKTGDLASMDEDGFITIRGRKKALIVNREGKNIYPEEVENVIAGDPLIADCVVVGYRVGRDPGEHVGVIVHPDEEALAARNGGKPMDWKDMERVARFGIRTRCQKLADYKRPRKILVLHEPLERTSIQKVRRVAYKGMLDE